MSACPVYGSSQKVSQQPTGFPQQIIAPPLSFITNSNCSIPPLCPMLPTPIPGQVPTTTWSLLNAPLHQVLPPPAEVSEGQAILPQPTNYILSAPSGQDSSEKPLASLDSVPTSCANGESPDSVKCVMSTTTPTPTIMSTSSSASASASSATPKAKPAKPQMKKRAELGSGETAASSKKSNQNSKRAPRRIWNDTEHSAYLRFIRHVSTNGRIDERVLASIPDRTLVQIKQYNYKYVVYRDNGLDVVDDVFARNPQTIVDFCNFITKLFTEHTGVKETGGKGEILLGLYDSVAVQWYLYHSLNILGTTASMPTSSDQIRPIPEMSLEIFTEISMGVTDVVQKPVFRNSSLQVSEMIYFMVTLRKYIVGNEEHIKAYNDFLSMLSALTDGVDFSRCRTRLTSEDLRSLFALCEDPSTADEAMEMALSMSPSVYVSFQCTPNADPGALRVVANLESCHLHIPHISATIFRMLCGVITQICREFEPRIYLYLTTAFQVYLQILNGTVEEIIYEIHKYGAPRCTKMPVSEQVTFIICLISYILCFSIIRYRDDKLR